MAIRRTIGSAAAVAALAFSPATASAAPTPQHRAATAGSADATQRDFRSVERSTQTRIGLFAHDTASGRTVRYRAGERFPMASVFKSYACAAVLDRARRSEPGLLKRRLFWNADQLLENSPITEKHVQTGLTVSQLCDATVRYSDNLAGNLILEQIDGPAGFTRYMRSIGDRVTRLDRIEPELNRWKPGSMLDTTTAAAAGRSLRVTTLRRSIPRADRRRMIDWLVRNTTGEQRIRAGLPSSWKAGDKTGTGGSYAWGNANDVAITWPPGRREPIVIAVLTNGRSAEAAPSDAAIKRATKIALRGLRVGTKHR